MGETRREFRFLSPHFAVFRETAKLNECLEEANLSPTLSPRQQRTNRINKHFFLDIHVKIGVGFSYWSVHICTPRTNWNWKKAFIYHVLKHF